MVEHQIALFQYRSKELIRQAEHARLARELSEAKKSIQSKRSVHDNYEDQSVQQSFALHAVSTST